MKKRRKSNNLINNKICSLVAKNINEIVEICRNAHMKEVYLVGSAVTDDFDDESDLDFLYYFDTKSSSFNVLDSFDYYLSFIENIRKVCNRSADMISGEDIKNEVLEKNLRENKVKIYEKVNSN